MIEIDDSEIRQMIADCSGDELKKLQTSSLRVGAKMIYSKAKSNFKSLLPASTKKGGHRSAGSTTIYFNDRLIDAIKMYVRQDRDFEYFFVVHTMGSRSSDSGTFRARFFEQGTVPRKTGKGYNRGQLKALNYFGSAVTSVQGAALDAVRSTFKDGFIKLANR